MAANNDPIYSRSPNVDWPAVMTAANTTVDLTAGTIYLVWTADATNGGFIQTIRIRAIPTIAATAATVARIWLNNGATTGTAANNILYNEISLPATTASATAATANYEVPMNIALDAGFRVYITLHTAPGGSTGWMATGVGGNY